MNSINFILNVILLIYLYWTYTILDDIWLNHCLRKRIKYADRSLEDRLKLIKISNKVSMTATTMTPYQKWIKREQLADQDFSKIFDKADSHLSVELKQVAQDMLNERDLQVHERKLNLFISSLFVIAATLF